MKKIKFTALVIAALSGLLLLQSCGGVNIIPDNISYLKGEKRIQVKYDYSQFGVGKFEREEDYVNMKMEKFDADEADKAKQWKINWIGDRIQRFQPMFEELINKYLEDINMRVNPSFDDSKYVMIVKTTYIEPGYNIYISRQPASINLMIKFYERSNPDKILGSIIVENAEGTSFGMSDYDSGERIKEAYAKAGKEFGKWIVDELGN